MSLFGLFFSSQRFFFFFSSYIGISKQTLSLWQRVQQITLFFFFHVGFQISFILDSMSLFGLFLAFPKIFFFFFVYWNFETNPLPFAALGV